MSSYAQTQASLYTHQTSSRTPSYFPVHSLQAATLPLFSCCYRPIARCSPSNNGSDYAVGFLRADFLVYDVSHITPFHQRSGAASYPFDLANFRFHVLDSLRRLDRYPLRSFLRSERPVWPELGPWRCSAPSGCTCSLARRDGHASSKGFRQDAGERLGEVDQLLHRSIERATGKNLSCTSYQARAVL